MIASTKHVSKLIYTIKQEIVSTNCKRGSKLRAIYSLHNQGTNLLVMGSLS